MVEEERSSSYSSGTEMMERVPSASVTSAATTPLLLNACVCPGDLETDFRTLNDFTVFVPTVLTPLRRTRLATPVASTDQSPRLVADVTPATSAFSEPVKMTPPPGAAT